MQRRQYLNITIIAVILSVAVACGATAPTEEAPEVVQDETPIAAAPVSDQPPDVDNDAPAGVCEDTANILSRVDRASRGLFRAVALDNRVGEEDGDGIRGVRFAVTGEGIAFAHDEVTAPYCIFGSNEPDCGDWPRDETGRYTWGVDGPVVQPGLYEVFIEVVGEQADSLSGSDRCNWSFIMRINAP